MTISNFFRHRYITLAKFGVVIHRASVPAYNNSPSVHVAACSYARWSAQRLLDISTSASLDGVSSSAVSAVGEHGHLDKQTILRASTASRSGRICLSRYVLTAVKKVLAVQVVRRVFKMGRGYLRLSCSLCSIPILMGFRPPLSQISFARRFTTLCPAQANTECCGISGGTTLAEL